jgi:hypothetical protein
MALGAVPPLAPLPAAAAAGPAALPAAAGPGPVVFNMAAVLAGATIPGYELPWDNYNNQLRQNLIREYQAQAGEPPAARGAPPPPPGAPPGADPVVIELTRIKNYLNEAGRGRKPANWNNDRMNAAVNRARDSPEAVALGAAIPFDVAAYRAAILASLNTNAPPGFNYRGVGP